MPPIVLDAVLESPGRNQEPHRNFKPGKIDRRTSASVKPVAPEGDSYLTMEEAEVYFGVKRTTIYTAYMQHHGLKHEVVRSENGKRKYYFFLMSELKRFKATYPGPGTPFRKMQLLKLAREGKKNGTWNETYAQTEQVQDVPSSGIAGMPDSGAMPRMSVEFPRQLTPYYFSIDARNTRQLRDMLANHFTAMQGHVQDVTLYSISGNGIITIIVDDRVLMFQCHVRNYIQIGATNRIRNWDKLEVVIATPEEMTFTFCSNTKLKLNRQ